MSSRPIFVATHPRACSTAFERVFMTQRDVLACVHEPFGDAFYYGPERLSERFEDDEGARLKSGFSSTTYKTVMDQLSRDMEEGKRVFIKDIAYYLFPPNGRPARTAPSLCHDYAKRSSQSSTQLNGTPAADGVHYADGIIGTAGHVNPTVIPTSILRRFHFTFLIRHPRRAIPSYFRCTVPPLDKVTGFSRFLPSEAGYDELRRLFDFLKNEEIVGPARAGEPNGTGDHVSITVIDADDLLDNPEKVIEAYCREVGLDYTPELLHWEDEDNQKYAAKMFAKWNGFHNDVLASTYLRPRSHGAKSVTTESEDEEWRKKYGEAGQKVIRECVDANTPHYEYLKSFALEI